MNILYSKQEHLNFYSVFGFCPYHCSKQEKHRINGKHANKQKSIQNIGAKCSTTNKNHKLCILADCPPPCMHYKWRPCKHVQPPGVFKSKFPKPIRFVMLRYFDLFCLMLVSLFTNSSKRSIFIFVWHFFSSMYYYSLDRTGEGPSKRHPENACHMCQFARSQLIV